MQRLVTAARFGPNTLLWHDVKGEGVLEVRGEAIRQLVEMVVLKAIEGR